MHRLLLELVHPTSKAEHVTQAWPIMAPHPPDWEEFREGACVLLWTSELHAQDICWQERNTLLLLLDLSVRMKPKHR